MSIDLDKTLFTTLESWDILSVMMTETATAPLTEKHCFKDKRIRLITARNSKALAITL